VTTLHLLRDQIRVCKACDLHKVGHGPVPLSGPTPNFLAVIGEAPGREEDERLEPFVGRAGTLMRECLNDAGFDPDHVTFLNAVSCFPDRTPHQSEINACSENLFAQLLFTNPKWAILVGNTPLHAFRPDLKITRARGKVMTPPGRSWKFFLTFHPSFALRNPRGEKIMRSDLERFAAILDAEPTVLDNGHEIEPWETGEFTDDSCVSCGATPDELGEHDIGLRFDSWSMPYCQLCYQQSPDAKQAEREQASIDRTHAKGRLL
jgi:uracil-DNA glycosylase family 4